MACSLGDNHICNQDPGNIQEVASHTKAKSRVQYWKYNVQYYSSAPNGMLHAMQVPLTLLFSNVSASVCLVASNLISLDSSPTIEAALDFVRESRATAHLAHNSWTS